MPYYDIQRLMDLADSKEVADFLGLETRKKGNQYAIKCPTHKGENFNCCKLTPKGYHCFGTCGGKTYSVIDMIMETDNVSVDEARGILGDIYGGRELFLLKGKDIPKKEYFPLTQEELAVIQLHPRIRTNAHLIITACYDAPPEGTFFKEVDMENDTEYFLTSEKQEFDTPLLSLYKEDYLEFCSLIKDKAKEAMELYQELIEKLKDKSFLYQIKLKKSVAYGVENIYLEKYIQSKKIYDNYELKYQNEGKKRTASKKRE